MPFLSRLRSLYRRLFVIEDMYEEPDYDDSQDGMTSQECAEEMNMNEFLDREYAECEGLMNTP